MTIQLNVRDQVVNESDATLLATDGIVTFPEAGRSTSDSNAADTAAMNNPPQFANVRDVSRFNYRGDWASGTIYKAGEFVRFAESLFLAIIDTDAPTSDTSWRRITVPNIFVNSDGDIGINGQPDTASALTIHQDDTHTNALHLDASALSGEDIQVYFDLSGTVDAAIKATATGNLELDADNDIIFRTRDTVRWGIEEDGTILPYGDHNIGTSANPVERAWIRNVQGVDHIDVGGPAGGYTENQFRINIQTEEGSDGAMSIIGTPTTLPEVQFWNSPITGPPTAEGRFTFESHDADAKFVVSGEFGLVLQQGKAFRPTTAWAVGLGGGLTPLADSRMDLGSDVLRPRTVYADAINAHQYLNLGQWYFDRDASVDLSTLPTRTPSTRFSGMCSDPIETGSFIVVSESDRKAWYWRETSPGVGSWSTIDISGVARPGWAPSGHAMYPIGQPAITHDGVWIQPVYIGVRTADASVLGGFVYTGGRYALYQRRIRSRGTHPATRDLPGTVGQQNVSRPFPSTRNGVDAHWYFGTFQAIQCRYLNVSGVSDVELCFFVYTNALQGSDEGDGYYMFELFGAAWRAHDETSAPADRVIWSDAHKVDGFPAYDDRADYYGIHDDGEYSWWSHFEDGAVHCFGSVRRAPHDGTIQVGGRFPQFDIAPATIPEREDHQHWGIRKNPGIGGYDELFFLDRSASLIDRVQFLVMLVESGGSVIQTDGGTGGTQIAFPDWLHLNDDGDVGLGVGKAATAPLTVESGEWTAASFSRTGSDSSTRIQVGPHSFFEGNLDGSAEVRWGTGVAATAPGASNEALLFKRDNDLLLSVSHIGSIIPDDVNGQFLGSESKYWAGFYGSEVFTSRLRPRTNSGHLEIGEENVATGTLNINMPFGKDIIPLSTGNVHLGSSLSRFAAVHAGGVNAYNAAGSVGEGVVRGTLRSPLYASAAARTSAHGSPSDGQVSIWKDGSGVHLDVADGGAWHTVGSVTHSAAPDFTNIASNVLPSVTDTYSLGSATRAWAGVHTQALRNSPNEFVDITAARFAGVLDASAVTEARGVATRLQVEQSQTDGILKFRLRDDTSASVLGSETIITDNMFSLAAAHAFGAATSANNGKVATYSHTHGRMILADPPGSSAASLSTTVDANGNIEFLLGGVYQTEVTPGAIERAFAHTFAGSERSIGRVLRVHPTTDGHIESVPIQDVIASASGSDFDFPHSIRMRTDGTEGGVAIGFDGDGDTGIYRMDDNQLGLSAGGHTVRILRGGNGAPPNTQIAVLPPVRSGYADWADDPAVLGANNYAGRWNEVHTGVLGYQELVQNSHLADKYNVEPSAFATVDAALKDLKVRKFEWKTAQGQKRYGIVLEETGATNTDTLLQGQDGVNISDLVMMLVRGYQTLARREEELRVFIFDFATSLAGLRGAGSPTSYRGLVAAAAENIVTAATAFAAEPSETVPASGRGTPP